MITYDLNFFKLVGFFFGFFLISRWGWILNEKLNEIQSFSEATRTWNARMIGIWKRGKRTSVRGKPAANVYNVFILHDWETVYSANVKLGPHKGHITYRLNLLVFGCIEVLVSTKIKLFPFLKKNKKFSHTFILFVSLSISTDYWRSLSAV